MRLCCRLAVITEGATIAEGVLSQILKDVPKGKEMKLRKGKERREGRIGRKFSPFVVRSCPQTPFRLEVELISQVRLY